jgi:phosphotransferase system HPr-like phosphotransfer protein
MPASSESITLEGDLHARPAGGLAVAAARFAAAVSVTAGARPVGARACSACWAWEPPTASRSR